MRKFILSALLLTICVTARAQVAISASSIKDSFETPIPLAKLCFVPTNAAELAAGFRVGSTQVVPNEVCGVVTTGILASGLHVAPSPSGRYYHVYLKQAFSNTILVDYGMTPITGSSWTLDTYDPALASVPASTLVVGTITTVSPGTPASCTVSGASPSLALNCSIPQGIQGPIGAPTSGVNLTPTTTQAVDQPAGTTLSITSVNDVVNLAALTDYADVCAAASAQGNRTEMRLPQGAYTCSNPLNLPSASSLSCPEGYSQTQITFTGSVAPYLTAAWANSVHGCSFVIPSVTAGDGIQLSGYQLKFYDDSVSGGAVGGKLIHITGTADAAQSGEVTLSNTMVSGYSGTALYIDHVIGVNLADIQVMGANTDAHGITIDTGTSGVNGSNVQIFASPMGDFRVQNSMAGAGAYGASPDFIYFDQFTADCLVSLCPTADGIVFDASLGASEVIATFTNSWVAGQGQNGAHISGGHSIHFESGTVVRSNALNGVLIDNANVSEVSIDDTVIDANNTSNNVDAHGVDVTAAATHISMTGGHDGNYPDTGGHQVYGVKVAAVAADNLQIVGTDLKGNGAGCYSSANTASQLIIINGATGDATCKSVLYGDLNLTGNLYLNQTIYASGLYTGGSATAANYTETLTTPASSSAGCAAGQFTDDAGYHYVCTAANTWKRVALSTF